MITTKIISAEDGDFAQAVHPIHILNAFDFQNLADEILKTELQSTALDISEIPDYHAIIQDPRPFELTDIAPLGEDDEDIAPTGEGRLEIAPTKEIIDQVRESIMPFIEQFNLWHRAWKAQNITAYLAFYTQDFFSRTSNQDITAWSNHKTRVFRQNDSVEVVFSHFTHFWNEDLIYIEVMQDYRANNFQNFGRKTLLWERRDSKWQIVAENWYAAPVPPPPPPDEPIVVDPPEIVIDPPPIDIVVPVPDTLRPKWEARVGYVPFDFINFLFPMQQNYGEILIIVEKANQHAATFRFSEDKREITLMEAYPISSGQAHGNKIVRGDLKTPEGLYITTRFRSEENMRSTYGRDALQFGTGAWVLNYPNQLDRIRRKTGSGIWIHGSDRAIVPFDTEGCVRFDNDVIDYFRDTLKLDVRTAVIINDEIDWRTVGSLDREVKAINSFLADWEDSWRNQDIEKYLAFYCGEEFITRRQRMDYTQWVNHKRRVFNPENTVNITFSDFYYYYADNLLLVTFYQDYSSGTFHSFGRKQLVLRRLHDSMGAGLDVASRVPTGLDVARYVPTMQWIIIQEEWLPATRPSGSRDIVINTGFRNFLYAN